MLVFTPCQRAAAQQCGSDIVRMRLEFQCQAQEFCIRKAMLTLGDQGTPQGQSTDDGRC